MFIIVVFAVLFGDTRATEMTNFTRFILYKSNAHGVGIQFNMLWHNQSAQIKYP